MASHDEIGASTGGAGDDEPRPDAGVPESNPISRPVTRRALLVGAGLAGVGAVAGGIALSRGREAETVAPPPTHALVGAPSTSTAGDPAIYGSPLNVTDHTLLEHDIAVSEVTIASGAMLEFAPDRDITLSCKGNVMVHGTLQMQPDSAQHTHALSFPAIDEQTYTGGMDMMPGDIGLWVMGGGALRLTGARRTAWTRAVGAVAAGNRSIDLITAPTGWLPGDEVVITPTASPSADKHYEAYDTVIIDSVRGDHVELRNTVLHDHPAVPVGRGIVLTAEVLNLTRNVRIEGRQTGRAHVWILSSSKQQLSQTAIRFMGPQKDNKGVLSRYPLHFHTCGDGSRGSQVRDVVVRDCGNHAFVAHASHGVTFSGCISHNTVDDAYWWDQAPSTRTVGPATDDVSYVGCVASQVIGRDKHSYRLTGFNLSTGSRDAIHGCVAVGVQGDKNSSGFEWPETGTGVWEFGGNIAHNNKVDGIFTWQNNNRDHIIERYVGYHNGQAGIEHGAYDNAYQYRDSVIYGNGMTGVLLHALSAQDHPQQFDGLLIDGGGASQYAVEVVQHTLPSTTPTLFTRCQMRGYTDAGFGFTYDGQNGPSQPERLDIVDCTFSGIPLRLSQHLETGSTIRIQGSSGPAMSVADLAGPGTRDRAWNGNVTTIAPFASPPTGELSPIGLPNSSPPPSGR